VSSRGLRIRRIIRGGESRESLHPRVQVVDSPCRHKKGKIFGTGDEIEETGRGGVKTSSGAAGGSFWEGEDTL